MKSTCIFQNISYNKNRLKKLVFFKRNEVKFKVTKLKEAEKEFENLSKEQQDLLNSDYKTIEEDGIEFVKTRFLSKKPKLFEIKTHNLRSLFKYGEDKIIVIGLIFTKDEPKTPKDQLKLAKKRLKP